MKQTDMRINSFDVLPNGTAKPSALMRYMQQCAREDSDLFGCTLGSGTTYAPHRTRLLFYPQFD